MSKTDLKKELLWVEKEKNWKLLSSSPLSGFEGLGVRTLEDICSRKFGVEIFKRKGVSIDNFSLSTDAMKIAFFMTDGLYIINSDGSNLELVTDTFEQIGSFGDGICWSPDDKKISFVGVPKGKYNREELNVLFLKFKHMVPQGLHVINLETKKVETIIEDGVWTIYTQAWSNDSKEILYINMDREIMIYNFESKSSRKLATGDNPSWSRDGKWIVFNPVRFDSVTKAFIYDDYCIIHPDGSDKQPLILNNKINFSFHPLWSPDNNYLLLFRLGVKFEAIIIPSHEYITIYIMDFRTKKIIKLGEGTVFTSWEGKP